MENIYYLLIVCLIFWYFIYLRKISEYARSHINTYCNTENLQFISLARKSSRISFDKRHGPHWVSVFEFEFSGDGESSYLGEMQLRGYKVDGVNMPPYKIH
ncbi:DUF3301 domain-containing protein [Colwellia sp. RE-S-Sl-9]